MKFVFLSCFALVLAACVGNEKEGALPETFIIVEGGNLFRATADLCGSTELDEQGRGRWRRWLKADERIARAPVRQHSKLGTVVLIPAGTYTVPRDLCESEESKAWMWLFLVLAGGICALLFHARNQKPDPEELGPVVLAKPDNLRSPVHTM